MIQTYRLSKLISVYYDLERKTIARLPTNSNLKDHGSDNSLYFGIVGNEQSEFVFCNLLDVKIINDISNKSFEMKCGSEMVPVCCNINHDGQIQIKIKKDGTMFRLTSNYAFDQMQNYDFTQMLIVIDFKNKEIRFKDPRELEL